MAEGEFALVRQHLEAGLKFPSAWIGDHDVYAMLADASAQLRDAGALRQYAPLAERSAARYDHTLYLAIAQRAWGVAYRLAGEYAESESRLKQALDLFQQLETRWQIGRTLFELGELATVRSSTVEARDLYARALGEFESIGAVRDARRTRTVLENLC